MARNDDETTLPVTLRDGVSADTKTLVELINEAYVAESHIVSGDRTDEVEIGDKLESGRFAVAEKDGRVVGCVYFKVDPPTSYLGLLAVDASQQGSGLGRRLVAFAEGEALRGGAGEVTILVIDLRRNLIGWYRSLGYAESGTRPFDQPERQLQTCHFVVMTKVLGSCGQ